MQTLPELDDEINVQTSRIRQKRRGKKKTND